MSETTLTVAEGGSATYTVRLNTQPTSDVVMTVSAAQERIAHAVVDASSADEFDAVTIAGVAVTVTDDDAAGAAVSETTLTVAEGGSATYTVRLNTTLTSSNWPAHAAVSDHVTVAEGGSAAQDADAVTASGTT